MQINLDKLRKIIEKHAKPRWDNHVDEWDLRKGGGEVYVQEKVLKGASPYLTKDAISQNTKESISSALKAHHNLLSSFEYMQAITFLREIDEKELKDKVSTLLYGRGSLKERLSSFLAWGKVKKISGKIPGKNIKYGFSNQVVSYFLAMLNPREYPYCKPNTYKSAVNALIGKDSKKRDPVERIVHCLDFYKKILELLETEYELKDGNLLDVHSLFYLFKEENWTDEESYTPNKKDCVNALKKVRGTRHKISEDEVLDWLASHFQEMNVSLGKNWRRNTKKNFKIWFK